MASQALLLAGGFGTRLGDLTKETPKPVLPVGGVPFLEHLIWNLRRHGITRILISTGYLADRVEAALGDGSRLGVELEYLVETEPLGTGGATKFARNRLTDEFFVLNGDTLYDCNYWAIHQAKRGVGHAGMALRTVPDLSRYGGCTLDSDGQVTRFQEKGQSGPGVINAGIYALDQSLLTRLPHGASSLERDLFPFLAEENRLSGVPNDGFFVDIGLPQTLAEANLTVPQWRHKPCAFLDRDGVLNVNTHHTYRVEDLQWMPDAKEAVRWLNDLGYLVLIVTNQAGIGKGKYTEPQFHEFMAAMATELHEAGAHWDGVYFCPYHPTEGIGEYLLDSPDRKPNPGMILKGIRDWNVRINGSFMVGDKPSDMEAASRAGIASHLYPGGQESLLEFVKNI